MTQAGLIVDAEDHDLAKAVINGDTYLHVAVELVKPTPPSPPATIGTPAEAAARRRADTARLDAVTHEAEDLAEDLADADVTTVAEGSTAAGDDSPAQRKPRRSAAVLNPAQRSERREITAAVDEQALAEIKPITGLIERLDAGLHDFGLDQVTGKTREVFGADLERLRQTIVWALGVLGRKEGE